MAKKPQVKCLYCSKSFYREDCDWEQIGRRYAHKECYEEHIRLNGEEEKIFNKCKELFGGYYNKARIQKQLKKFYDDGLTKEGIYNAIEYWFDIKNEDVSKANNGIGIVPFVYDEAQRHAARVEEMKKAHAQTDIMGKFLNAETEEFVIKKPKFSKPKKIKLFDLK